MRRSKHYRKLEKKAARIKKEMASHPHIDGWQADAFPYRKKVKIVIERTVEPGYPQRKQAIIGLKEELNLNNFLGKFQPQ